MTENRIRFPLHTQILVALLLGAVIGGSLQSLAFVSREWIEWVVSNITEPLGQAFLRSLMLLVIPLVASSLISGMASLAEAGKIGRIGVKSLLLTVIFSALSVGIGLLLSNIIEPGHRIDSAIITQLRDQYAPEASKVIETGAAAAARSRTPLMSLVRSLIPTNIFSSLSSDPPDMLGVMFFALLIGAGAAAAGEKARSLLSFMDGLFETANKCIELVMRVSPFAVFCLIFTMTARFGFSLLGALASYSFTVLLGLSIQMFVVYSLALFFLARINPIEFFRRIRTVLLTAFSTASSNATLPQALRASHERIGVPGEINTFVLTIGATANQNGTALYEGVTVLFLSQIAGVDLSIGQQLSVLYLAILGGIGTAGVPAGSIPFILLILTSVGVNPALIAVILGLDRFLDMCRTTLNVAGDITIAAAVARSENAPLLPQE